MEILKVVEPIVLSNALKLANVWAREFDLVVDYESDSAGGFWQVRKERSGGKVYEIILRRSAQGYWVELFKDGFTVRSVEVY